MSFPLSPHATVQLALGAIHHISVPGIASQAIGPNAGFSTIPAVMLAVQDKYGTNSTKRTWHPYREAMMLLVLVFGHSTVSGQQWLCCYSYSS
eukprot:2819305-Rhodomonas_salina.1